jgi:hypothetical protein
MENVTSEFQSAVDGNAAVIAATQAQTDAFTANQQTAIAQQGIGNDILAQIRDLLAGGNGTISGSASSSANGKLVSVF